MTTFATRTCRLRPLRGTDTDWLYELLTGVEGTRWRYRGRTPSPGEFATELWRGIHAQFVATDPAGTPAGLVGLYNSNPQASHCHLFAVGTSDQSTTVTEAAGVLVNWAFDEFDLQKIWVEAPEFNLEQFASLTAVADVEGRLVNFDYWRGRFWDLFILSINRQRWDERHRGLVERRTTTPTPTDRPLLELEDLERLLDELWPLDSLGRVELLTILEDATGTDLSNEVFEGLDVLGPADGAATLLDRLTASPASTFSSCRGTRVAG